MNPQDVADYLEHHPEFFEDHAALFAALTVPHPHGGRAIPLAERQMITLREKNRALELKVAELMRYGQENDAIAERLARWTRLLLLQRSPRLLPETLTGSLEEIFTVPHVALTLWEAADEYRVEARLDDATPALIAYVETLGGPYCGEVRSQAATVLPLFAHQAAGNAALDATTPDGVAADGASAAHVRSVALIPLRRGAAPVPFGLLALGSADPRRFHDGMGTDFLARIGENSSAALTRLLR
jgi:uncharacterized protein YigA (DUF484 family)